MSVRVLVIDDSNTIRVSAKEILEQAGYHVTVAENGLEALSVAAECDPQIILTDITMPKLDGFEVMSLLRMNPRMSEVPIVVFSSRNGVFDIARGSLLGCAGYVTKPFVPEELVRTVARLVPQEEIE